MRLRGAKARESQGLTTKKKKAYPFPSILAYTRQDWWRRYYFAFFSLGSAIQRIRAEISVSWARLFPNSLVNVVRVVCTGKIDRNINFVTATVSLCGIIRKEWYVRRTNTLFVFSFFFNYWRRSSPRPDSCQCGSLNIYLRYKLRHTWSLASILRCDAFSKIKESLWQTINNAIAPCWLANCFLQHSNSHAHFLGELRVNETC